MSTIDLSGEFLVQSPYTYMQAAGSDGSDHTVKGFHLRWDFKKILQENHLPKGNLSGPSGSFPATYGFNRDNDFVSIHRALFVERYYTEVDFSNNPTTIVDAGGVREWRYSGIIPLNLTGGYTSKVIITFPDTAYYDSIKSTYNPATNALDFLKNYNREIRVRLEDKLCFRIEWHLGMINRNDPGSASLRYETVSLSDTSDNSSEFVSCRNDVDGPKEGVPVVVTCEDVRYVRFDRDNVFPQKMRLYGYDDYIIGLNQNSAWTNLGDFALTNDQGTAFNRLENPALFTINNKWPKFNEIDLGTGAFTVKTTNYEDRWTNADGLEFGVEKYLTLSQSASNHKAVEVVDADPIGAGTDDSKTEISYMDLLSMVSIDFHVARMLGLGYIDSLPEVRETDLYIYLMKYTTEANLEDGGGAREVKHLYMTPNIKSTDFKLPQQAEISGIDYGLYLENGTPEPTQLTDDNGYAKYADIRFININRASMNYERDIETFFQTNDEFCLCSQSNPVAFGLEYALSGEPYVKPELNHDSSYNDSTGIPETIVIPNNEQNPVYRHQETEEGIHCYALYSINWFSRAAASGTDACTNYTEFVKRNTILPPANLAVQLIQPETPLILTTGQEQIDYNAITGDKTYLRTSFDWNHIHHKAYQFANKAELFFNKTEKQVVQGKILALTALPDHKVQITTTSYDILAVSPMETVTPQIIPGDESLFVGSLLSCDGLNYRVESVSTVGSGENPTFILHQIRETHSMEDPVGSNIWTTTETWVSPAEGERFLVSENVNDTSSWDNRLLKTVYLEKFGINDKVTISGSSLNDGDYSVDTVNLVGSNTEIVVKESIYDSVIDGDLNYEMAFVSVGFNVAETGFLISGDVSSDLTGVTALRVEGSDKNDGDYTINSFAFGGTNTEVILNEPLDNTNWVGKLFIPKQASVTAYNTGTSTITVSGNLTSLITPTRKETRTNEDGSTTEFTIGGFTENCEVVEKLDVYNPDTIPVDPPGPGDPIPGDDIPGSRTGIYDFIFTGNPLPPHIDPDVNWFRGKVRVMEDASFLPTPLGKSTALIKELDVWNVAEDGSGNLILTVYDPTFEVDPSYTPTGEYLPIITGASIEINYHPSYLFYLDVDEYTVDGTINEFNEASILPVLNEGSRKTFLGIRAIDSIDSNASHISTPAAIVAEEIREPLPPNPPAGPLYATRPDFYGKSTYSMDISFTNIPYSVLVYRANERLILSALYTQEKIDEILDDLAMLPQPDAFFTERWEFFVNVNTVDDAMAPDFELFPTNGPEPFRFPIPNNVDYVIPQTIGTGSEINPFNGVDKPGSTTITFAVPGNPAMTMKQVVKEAITGAFISQTKAPILFEHVKNGVQTNNQPPRLRDDNDNLIAPSSGNPLYDPTPFAVKLPSGDLRFTDYNIDGGSNSFYFYYAMELSAKQKKSAPSDIVGPIQLVNTRPAKAPNIKQIVTQVKNEAEGIETAVCFKIEDYIASEGISRIDIYRAINSADAISIRTMDLAAEIEITGTIGDTELCDMFEGLDFPLYGEDLHYRLVAIRRILLEDGVTVEYIPSEPSKLVKTSLVDPDNPPAPCLVSENGITTAAELNKVVLKWNQVAYNATYSLQKMNESGNWETFYSIISNESEMQYPPYDGGVDFIAYPETIGLSRLDANGNAIYNRFRVQAENSSGLFNLTDCPLTLATGCFDLETLSEVVNFEDDYGFTLSELSSQLVDDGTNNHPGKMIFTANVPSILPAGHTAFDKLEVSVTDDLGNTASATILTPTGSHTFVDGDGDTGSDNLQLNDANRTYTVTTKLYTDFCTTGYKRVAELSYVHGPCHDLSQLTNIIQIADSSHTYALTDYSNLIDDGIEVPVSLTITDISDAAGMTNPQTFDSLEITIIDGLANSDVKTITTAGGNVTFNDGDNGLVLNDASSNRNYEVTAILKTTECMDGKLSEYFIQYTFSPCQELAAVENVLSFTDSNSGALNPLVSGEINEGTNHPGGSIVFTDLLSANLPTGHTLSSIEIDLYDGNGGFASKSLPLSGSVTFNSGDGDPGNELDLGATNPNLNISIQVLTQTDLCSNGTTYVYDLNYTYDPYEDLGAQTDVVNFSDANGLTKNPLDSSEFNDGVNTHPGGTITITETISSNLPAGDTFDKVEVTLEDGLGNLLTQEITIIGDSADFDHGDGGLVLNGSDPNRTYTFSIKVFTALCPDGVLFVYSGRYTFGV